MAEIGGLSHGIKILEVGSADGLSQSLFARGIRLQLSHLAARPPAGLNLGDWASLLGPSSRLCQIHQTDGWMVGFGWPADLSGRCLTCGYSWTRKQDIDACMQARSWDPKLAVWWIWPFFITAGLDCRALI